MKQLAFKLWGLLAFRLTKRNNIALILNDLNDTPASHKALDFYQKNSNKRKVFILIAYNNAELGDRVQDYRDIFVFNNNPMNLAKFCYKYKISTLYYYNNFVLANACKKFGLNVIFEN